MSRRQMIKHYFGIVHAAENRRIKARGMSQENRRIAVALANADIRCAMRIATKIANGM